MPATPTRPATSPGGTPVPPAPPATSPGDSPIRRWQFQRGYPFYPSTAYGSPVTGQVVVTAGQRFGGGRPVAVRPLTSFLHAYQLDGGYTPGPLLAFTVLAGLAGTLSLLRRRAAPAQHDAARACLLAFTAAVGVLIISDAFEFTWRYQLPALVTLPPAAALGLTALFAHRRQATAQSSGAPAAGGQAPLPAGGPGTAAGSTALAGPARGGRPTPEDSEHPGPQARDRTPAS